MKSSSLASAIKLCGVVTVLLSALSIPGVANPLADVPTGWDAQKRKWDYYRKMVGSEALWVIVTRQECRIVGYFRFLSEAEQLEPTDTALGAALWRIAIPVYLPARWTDPKQVEGYTKMEIHPRPDAEAMQRVLAREEALWTELEQERDAMQSQEASQHDLLSLLERYDGERRHLKPSELSRYNFEHISSAMQALEKALQNMQEPGENWDAHARELAQIRQELEELMPQAEPLPGRLLAENLAPQVGLEKTCPAGLRVVWFAVSVTEEQLQREIRISYNQKNVRRGWRKLAIYTPLLSVSAADAEGQTAAQREHHKEQFKISINPMDRMQARLISKHTIPPQSDRFRVKGGSREYSSIVVHPVDGEPLLIEVSRRFGKGQVSIGPATLWSGPMPSPVALLAVGVPLPFLLRRRLRERRKHHHESLLPDPADLPSKS